MGKGLTRGPHLAARQGDGYEVDGLRWAERKGRPAGCAGRMRKMGVARQTLVEWVMAQN
jgi:hypothetical protein